MADVTAQELREMFAYDPATGIFTRLQASGRHGRHPAGAVAGCVNTIGYTVIRIGTKLYYAHRLAWLHVTGDWPIKGIDHKDGNRGNNAIGNLRPAGQAENLQNLAGPCGHSQTGVLGVSWIASDRKWLARLKVGELRHSSRHETLEEAELAYKQAKAKLHPFSARM